LVSAAIWALNLAGSGDFAARAARKAMTTLSNASAVQAWKSIPGRALAR